MRDNNYPCADHVKRWDKRWGAVLLTRYSRRFPRLSWSDVEAAWWNVLHRAAAWDFAPGDEHAERCIFSAMMKRRCLGLVRYYSTKNGHGKVCGADLEFIGSVQSREVPDDVDRVLAGVSNTMWKRMIDAMKDAIDRGEDEHGSQEAVAHAAGLTFGTYRVQKTLMRASLSGGLDGVRSPSGRPYLEKSAPRGKTVGFLREHWNKRAARREVSRHTGAA